MDLIGKALGVGITLLALYDQYVQHNRDAEEKEYLSEQLSKERSDAQALREKYSELLNDYLSISKTNKSLDSLMGLQYYQDQTETLEKQMFDLRAELGELRCKTSELVELDYYRDRCQALSEYVTEIANQDIVVEDDAPDAWFDEDDDGEDSVVEDAADFNLEDDEEDA